MGLFRKISYPVRAPTGALTKVLSQSKASVSPHGAQNDSEEIGES